MKTSSDAQYAQVAVFSAVEKVLGYLVPAGLRAMAAIGSLVLVPLNRGVCAGVVTAFDDDVPRDRPYQLKPLIAVSDSFPPLPPDLIRLGLWMAQYYVYPPGETLYNILPPGIRRRPEPVWRLSEEGLRAAHDPEAPELCRLLAETGPLPLRQLKGRLKSTRGLERTLRDLLHQGRLVKDYPWVSPDRTGKRIKRIRLVKEPRSVGRRSSTLLQLVSLLKASGGVMALHELRQSIGNVDYWVRKLGQSGHIEVTEHAAEELVSYAQDIPAAPPLALTGQQQAIYDRLVPALGEGRFRPLVLHGVTGSGKTELYLRLAQAVVDRGRTAMVLVPEIALSTQLEALFAQRFGKRLATWHSGLTPAHRRQQWLSIARGERTVVLGVRSAVFAPLADPGLIIIDEEHDSSYKQEDRLRYHARDVALMRAKLVQIPILLGSATPSLQTIHHVHRGRYELLSLPNRIDDRPLPEFQIVDMRRQRGPFRFLSRTLQEALRETLDQQQQALLFLNRRGFATFVVCRLCGEVIHCRHCSVSLTYHQQGARLCCHYCGFTSSLPDTCPRCGKPSLMPFGLGTERIEEEVRRILPQARLVRIDRDTAAHPRQILSHLNKVRDRRADILIGTQMIAKGHDFPGVTLVGVVSADTSLQLPDYRAGETTVQLLVQVAGRAGRGEEPGKVIVQTYNPRHYVIEALGEMDYLEFCRHELRSRKQLQYPPFCRLVKFLITARKAEQARSAAQQFARLSAEVIDRLKDDNIQLALLGPAPAPIAKLKNRYRWHLYVKGWRSRDIQQMIETVLGQADRIGALRRVDLAIDRDPVSNY